MSAHPCFPNAQVLQAMTQEQREVLTTLKMRYKARDFAIKTVKSQRDQFKRCAHILTPSLPAGTTILLLFKFRSADMLRRLMLVYQRTEYINM